jgi:YidC/Oxa1 family membrane protein insertase
MDGAPANTEVPPLTSRRRGSGSSPLKTKLSQPGDFPVNIINQAMLYLLNAIHDFVGNYGLAIVLLTVAIRLVLWPLNSAQTRSMRKMQELQPKLKALQEKYKSEPQKMQEAMMKFYSENSFNPLAGCLPMLVQLPIFIGLYGALSSPHFLADTVHEKFLFLNNLSHTLQSHAGESLDSTFNVEKDDAFSVDKTVILNMLSGKTQEQEVTDQHKLITIAPKPILPGSPITMVLDFKHMGLSDDYKSLVKSAEVLVVNEKSRELERIHFNNVNGVLTQEVPTLPGKTQMNWDVLALIVIYALLTLAYQQLMTAKQPKAAKDDAAGQAMQSPAMKFMPLMFVVVMFFIPIPAGALIYLVVTTALMLIQTLWVNYSEDKKAENKEKPSTQVVDIKADRV